MDAPPGPPATGFESDTFPTEKEFELLTRLRNGTYTLQMLQDGTVSEEVTKWNTTYQRVLNRVFTNNFTAHTNSKYKRNMCRNFLTGFERFLLNHAIEDNDRHVYVKTIDELLRELVKDNENTGPAEVTQWMALSKLLDCVIQIKM